MLVVCLGDVPLSKKMEVPRKYFLSVPNAFRTRQVPISQRQHLLISERATVENLN